MRSVAVIGGMAMLAACNISSAKDDSGTNVTNGTDAERAELKRRADNPDFSAVDALANGASATADSAPTATAGTNEARSDAAPSGMRVVTDPAAGIEAAIAVSARGDDGLKSLPLSPDLLVALRRTEARGEVGAYDHDFLTGGQEPLPVRNLSSSTRRTGTQTTVTSRFVVEGVGPRSLVSLWSPRNDGSFQLDDLQADGTTLSALLAKGS